MIALTAKGQRHKRKELGAMKRILANLLVISLLFGIEVQNVVFAEDTSDSGVVEVDGVDIYYDNNAVNGGVDIDKDKGYVNENGVNIYYDNHAINGGVDLEAKPAYQGVNSSVVLPIVFEHPQSDKSNAFASMAMLLSTIGYPMTQQELATVLDMNNIESKQIAEELNSIVKDSNYHFTSEYHDFNVETIRNHVVEALNVGNPILVHTVETSSDWYIEGHGLMGSYNEYCLVGDYFDYGAEVTIVNMNQGIYDGFNLNQKVSIQALSNATGGSDYVW